MFLQKNENQDIEFKQSWRDEYLKWICAFANSNGGKLYIGVKDNGEVCGIEDFHKLTEDIPNKIRHTMGLLCEVNLLSDKTLKYFEIGVEKYPFPVSYHGKYYKRIGSTLQKISGLELDKLILSVQGRTWDSIPVPYIKSEDLDKKAIERFKQKAIMRERYTKEALDVSSETLIRNLLGYENEYLTRAAMMCFYDNPEKFCSGAYIKIAYFQTDADIVFQDEIHGALINQVDEALDLIYTKYMKALIDYDGIYRRETYFFPIDAFRELLLNAVIHKDYMQPYPIQIKVYPSKILIWNIGAMPEQIKVENLYETHFSVPRNPNIASVFFKCGSIESWGRGYYNIAQYCKAQDAVLPIPEENSGGIVVQCNASEKYIKLAEKWNITNNDESSPESSPESSLTTAQKILFFMKEKPSITTQEIADKIGISKRAVLKQIANLKGKVEHIGSTKKGYWKVNEE